MVIVAAVAAAVVAIAAVAVAAVVAVVAVVVVVVMARQNALIKHSRLIFPPLQGPPQKVIFKMVMSHSN